jgi:hypothetical protein
MLASRAEFGVRRKRHGVLADPLQHVGAMATVCLALFLLLTALKLVVALKRHATI